MVQAQYPAGFLVLLLWGAAGAAWGATGEGPVRETTERAALVAMERAQRQAASPLKAIIEAAKIERRPLVAAVPVVPVAATPPRRAAVRTAIASLPPSPVRETIAAAFVLPADATSAGELSMAGALAAELVPAPPVPAEVTLPALDGPQPSQPAAAPQVRTEPKAVTAPSSLLSADLGEARLARPAAAEPSTGLPLPTQALSDSAAISAAAPVQPRLVRSVQPTVPLHMWDGVARGSEINVDLDIRTDGTVGAVNLVGHVPRAFARAVQAAITQWVFEPLPAPQVHRVQLVLSPPER